MTVPTPKPSYSGYYRVQIESSYGAGGGTAEWNLGGNGGGATGWRDAPVVAGQAPLSIVETPIFSTYQAGKRALNLQAPVPGRQMTTGSLEMPVFFELVDPFLRACMGSVNRAETAGAAALASTAFASVATLDTQPNGTEILKFTIASSSAASSAVINIIQSAATQESINIGTNAGSVDGVYYSKGAYDGSSNAITFSVSGTVTSGMVTIAGVDKVTNTFTLGTSNPSLRIEEGGGARSGSSSFFVAGVVVPQMVWNFDATAEDGLLMATADIEGQYPDTDTAGTWANEAALYRHPLGGWTASATLGGAAYDKIQTGSLTMAMGNHLFATATGSQEAGGKTTGPAEMTGSLTIIPADGTEWGYYVGQTVSDVHVLFTSPRNIVDSTKFTLLFEFTKLYIESYVENRGDPMYTATLGFRTIEDSSDGIAKVTMVSRMPV